MVPQRHGHQDRHQPIQVMSLSCSQVNPENCIEAGPGTPLAQLLVPVWKDWVSCFKSFDVVKPSVY